MTVRVEIPDSRKRGLCNYGGTMRAIVVTEPGEVDALTVVDIPVPEPGRGEVLIKVVAAGINRADLLQRQGFYDPPAGATPVLGLECSGTIEALGDGATQFQLGQQVCALLSGGAYAEYVTAPAGQVAAVPIGVNLVDAAGLMEVASTVWSNVFMMGKLQPGETLLVHGGSSGIGTMAIQLAKAFGARVVVTAGTAEKLAFCRDLGADLAINYREQDFAQVFADEGIVADVILDIMGAKYLAQNIAVLNMAGRLVVIGLQGGIKAELNLNSLLRKRAAIMATSLRARPSAEKAVIVDNMVGQVWPLLRDGTIKPVIHRIFELDEAAAAHQMLEDSSHIGKVLLTV